jgi:PAS domain S-box-containing protein
MVDDEADKDAHGTGAPDAVVLRAMVDASPNGAVLVNGAGRIAFVNREARRLFGYGDGELVGGSVEQLVPAALRDTGADFRQTSPTVALRPVDTGQGWVGLRRDGTEIPIDVGVTPIDTLPGRSILYTVVDRTVRRAGDARFRVAVEASPHGMMMVDQSGHIVLVNREVERMFGYSREELLGQLVELLVPVPLRARHPAQRASFHGDPRSRPMGAGRDLFGRRRDGTEFPVEIGLNPIESDEGVLVLASVIDIGPRKRAEEELRRSNLELEQFAYVASHDLQEPLRTVASFVQLLARRYRDRLDQDGMEFIDFAVGGVTRMQRLIEDLLRFSRVGTRGAAPVPTDAGAALRTVVQNLRAAIDESGAIVEHGPLPRVLVDPVQFEQLLMNLVGNALKFRGTGAPVVQVDAQPEGRWWRFRVRDNGIGIDPQYFDRIFVIFQRLHAREEYPGTGVGLAICKKIVERHGGRIHVESTRGTGATFTFTLPMVPE